MAHITLILDHRCYNTANSTGTVKLRGQTAVFCPLPRNLDDRQI